MLSYRAVAVRRCVRRKLGLECGSSIQETGRRRFNGCGDSTSSEFFSQDLWLGIVFPSCAKAEERRLEAALLGESGVGKPDVVEVVKKLEACLLPRSNTLQGGRR